jgi:hypothetical protein
MSLYLNRAVPALLERAKGCTAPASDEYKIAMAFKALYPEELKIRKALPGYTPQRLLGEIMFGIRRWSRVYMPDLFRHIMLARYTNGGMSRETAQKFIEGELAAQKRGEIYSRMGEKLL